MFSLQLSPLAAEAQAREDTTKHGHHGSHQLGRAICMADDHHMAVWMKAAGARRSCSALCPAPSSPQALGDAMHAANAAMQDKHFVTSHGHRLVWAGLHNADGVPVYVTVEADGLCQIWKRAQRAGSKGGAEQAHGWALLGTVQALEGWHERGTAVLAAVEVLDALYSPAARTLLLAVAQRPASTHTTSQATPHVQVLAVPLQVIASADTVEVQDPLTVASLVCGDHFLAHASEPRVLHACGPAVVFLTTDLQVSCWTSSAGSVAASPRPHFAQTSWSSLCVELTKAVAETCGLDGACTPQTESSTGASVQPLAWCAPAHDLSGPSAPDELLVLCRTGHCCAVQVNTKGAFTARFVSYIPALTALTDVQPTFTGVRSPTTMLIHMTASAYALTVLLLPASTHAPIPPSTVMIADIATGAVLQVADLPPHPSGWHLVPGHAQDGSLYLCAPQHALAKLLPPSLPAYCDALIDAIERQPVINSTDFSSVDRVIALRRIAGHAVAARLLASAASGSSTAAPSVDPADVSSALVSNAPPPHAALSWHMIRHTIATAVDARSCGLPSWLSTGTSASVQPSGSTHSLAAQLEAVRKAWGQLLAMMPGLLPASMTAQGPGIASTRTINTLLQLLAVLGVSKAEAEAALRIQLNVDGSIFGPLDVAGGPPSQLLGDIAAARIEALLGTAFLVTDAEELKKVEVRQIHLPVKSAPEARAEVLQQVSTVPAKPALLAAADDVDRELAKFDAAITRMMGATSASEVGPGDEDQLFGGGEPEARSFVTVSSKAGMARRLAKPGTEKPKEDSAGTVVATPAEAAAQTWQLPAVSKDAAAAWDTQGHKECIPAILHFLRQQFLLRLVIGRETVTRWKNSSLAAALQLLLAGPGDAAPRASASDQVDQQQRLKAVTLRSAPFPSSALETGSVYWAMRVRDAQSTLQSVVVQTVGAAASTTDISSLLAELPDTLLHERMRVPAVQSDPGAEDRPECIGLNILEQAESTNRAADAGAGHAPSSLTPQAFPAFDAIARLLATVQPCDMERLVKSQPQSAQQSAVIPSLASHLRLHGGQQTGVGAAGDAGHEPVARALAVLPLPSAAMPASAALRMSCPTVQELLHFARSTQAATGADVSTMDAVIATSSIHRSSSAAPAVDISVAVRAQLLRSAGDHIAALQLLAAHRLWPQAYAVLAHIEGEDDFDTASPHEGLGQVHPLDAEVAAAVEHHLVPLLSGGAPDATTLRSLSDAGQLNWRSLLQHSRGRARTLSRSRSAQLSESVDETRVRTPSSSSTTSSLRARSPPSGSSHQRKASRYATIASAAASSNHTALLATPTTAAHAAAWMTMMRAALEAGAVHHVLQLWRRVPCTISLPGVLALVQAAATTSDATAALPAWSVLPMLQALAVTHAGHVEGLSRWWRRAENEDAGAGKARGPTDAILREWRTRK